MDQEDIDLTGSQVFLKFSFFGSITVLTEKTSTYLYILWLVYNTCGFCVTSAEIFIDLYIVSQLWLFY